MNNSEINNRSAAIFRYKMPISLIIRSQEDQDDYGVDFEIEPRSQEGDGVTGRLFKVQLKGHENITYIENQSKVSHGGLNVDRLNYYLNHLKIPIVLVVADITTEKLYWEVLTGNAKAIAVYESATHETCTLHISSQQELPGTLTEMVSAIENGRLWLEVRGVLIASKHSFANACRHVDPTDMNRMAADFMEKASILDLSAIEALIDEHRFAEARSRALELINADSTPAPTVLAAIVELDRINGGIYLMSNGDRRQGLLEVADLIKSKSSRLFTRTSGPVSWVYGLFYYRSIEIKMLGDGLFGLAVSIRNQSEIESRGGSAMGLPINRWQFWEAQREWQRAVGSALNCIVRAACRGAWHLPVQILAKVLLDAREGILAIGMVEGDDAASRLADLMTTSSESVIHVAVAMKDWLGLEFLVIALTAFPSQEKSIWSTSRTFALLEESGCPPSVVAQIRTQVEKREQALAKAESDAEGASPRTPEELRAFYEDLAARLGINLDDPDDDIAHIVRIGLEDLNPERVLRQCTELCASIESNGMPAQMLGLPTAGSKRLTCLKHGFAISGVSLDSTHALMKQMHCDECPDICAHHSDWQWSDEWQQAQQQRLEDLRNRQQRRQD